MFLLYVWQFSVTEHFKDGNVRQKSQPSVIIYYDFSPIKVLDHTFVRHFPHKTCAHAYLCLHAWSYIIIH